MNGCSGYCQHKVCLLTAVLVMVDDPMMVLCWNESMRDWQVGHRAASGHESMVTSDEPRNSSNL